MITGKGFLVSLSFCSNFCCSLCQALLQREVLHQLGWCPGLRMAQAKDSAGHKGQTGRSQAGDEPRHCDRHGAWICISGSRGLVFPGVSWATCGGWAGEVSSASCHHRHQLHQITQCLSLWVKRKPSFPLHMHLQERRKPNLCPVGLYLRWAALEPGLVLDGKWRASWMPKPAHYKDGETMSMHIILFLQLVSYPSLYF